MGDVVGGWGHEGVWPLWRQDIVTVCGAYRGNIKHNVCIREGTRVI